MYVSIPVLHLKFVVFFSYISPLFSLYFLPLWWSSPPRIWSTCEWWSHNSPVYSTHVFPSLCQFFFVPCQGGFFCERSFFFVSLPNQSLILFSWVKIVLFCFFIDRHAQMHTNGTATQPETHLIFCSWLTFIHPFLLHNSNSIGRCLLLISWKRDIVERQKQSSFLISI